MQIWGASPQSLHNPIKWLWFWNDCRLCYQGCSQICKISEHVGFCWFLPWHFGSSPHNSRTCRLRVKATGSQLQTARQLAAGGPTVSATSWVLAPATVKVTSPFMQRPPTTGYLPVLLKTSTKKTQTSSAKLYFGVLLSVLNHIYPRVHNFKRWIKHENSGLESTPRFSTRRDCWAFHAAFCFRLSSSWASACSIWDLTAFRRCIVHPSWDFAYLTMVVDSWIPSPIWPPKTVDSPPKSWTIQPSSHSSIHPSCLCASCTLASCCFFLGKHK